MHNETPTEVEREKKSKSSVYVCGCVLVSTCSHRFNPMNWFLELS